MAKKIMPVDLIALRVSIADWLDQMAEGISPGRFRFCAKGSFVPTDGKAAQVSTCFAMKTAWQTGIWENWNEERRRACVDFVKSFQTPEGWFEDPWLETKAKPGLKDIACLVLGRTSWRRLKNIKVENIRAETRQSAATLLMVGEKPDYPLPQEINHTGDAQNYVHSLDWSKPWV